MLVCTENLCNIFILFWTISLNVLILGRLCRVISASPSADVMPTKHFILWPWQRKKLAWHYITLKTFYATLCKKMIIHMLCISSRKCKTVQDFSPGQLYHVNSSINNFSLGQTHFLLHLSQEGSSCSRNQLRSTSKRRRHQRWNESTSFEQGAVRTNFRFVVVEKTLFEHFCPNSDLRLRPPI
jgi:hypothetical protein